LRDADGGERAVAAVMRWWGELNTPAVRDRPMSAQRCRPVSDGRTIDDFRPRHLWSSVHDIDLEPEERALYRCFVRGAFASRAPLRRTSISLVRRNLPVKGGFAWPVRPFSFATTAVRKSVKERAQRCGSRLRMPAAAPNKLIFVTMRRRHAGSRRRPPRPPTQGRSS
jgi:hypothetical protein